MAEDLSKDRTKNDLDDALRQLLEQKPLDQIRIRELTDLCGIRRQSFYYHFPDVWALFDWSLRMEARRLPLRQQNCFTWRQALMDLLHHTARHRRYYQALLDSRGRVGLRTVMQDALHSLLTKTLAYYQQRCGTQSNPDFDHALLNCWETLLLTLLESWIQEDFLESPEELLPFVEVMVRMETTDIAWRNFLKNQ